MLSLLLRKSYLNKLLAADLSFEQRLKKTIRALSTRNYSTPLSGARVYIDERREYLAVVPDLFRNLKEYASKFQSKDVVQLYEKALKYNVTGRKQHTGIITVLAYKELANKVQLNSKNIELAQYLGWCVDMIQNSFLILDDIMDGSVTRRGQPCLHMLEEVGLSAINDSLIILSGAFHILQVNFAQKDYYVKLLELVHDVILITTFGQSMDLQASKSDVSSFTMDGYKSIVANKGACLGLYFPIALAMHLCCFTDPDIYRQSRATLYELSTYFQIENDYNDCFGDQTGKIGNDIQENKCTWLAVVCMERASVGQKKIMRECYGKYDPVKIAQVKHLYEELGLPKIFTAYKEEAYNKIITHIQQNSEAGPSRLYKIVIPFVSKKARADLIGSSHISA